MLRRTRSILAEQLSGVPKPDRGANRVPNRIESFLKYKSLRVGKMCDVLTDGLDDLQIIDVVSRSVLLRPLLVGRGVPGHSSPATAASPNPEKVSDLFHSDVPRHVERKEASVQRSTLAVFLDRVRADRPHICSS